jgi:hypothetical protein
VASAEDSSFPETKSFSSLEETKSAAITWTAGNTDLRRDGKHLEKLESFDCKRPNGGASDQRGLKVGKLPRGNIGPSLRDPDSGACCVELVSKEVESAPGSMIQCLLPVPVIF